MQRLGDDHIDLCYQHRVDPTVPIEDSSLPTIREPGIGLVACSPLGRGFLTGAITDPSALAADDFRRADPRFQGAALEAAIPKGSVSGDRYPDLSLIGK